MCGSTWWKGKKSTRGREGIHITTKKEIQHSHINCTLSPTNTSTPQPLNGPRSMYCEGGAQKQQNQSILNSSSVRYMCVLMIILCCWFKNFRGSSLSLNKLNLNLVVGVALDGSAVQTRSSTEGGSILGEATRLVKAGLGDVVSSSGAICHGGGLVEGVILAGAGTIGI